MKFRDWLRRGSRRESEWQEELQSHLELREEWNQQHGMPADAARLQARKQFGNSLRALENLRSEHIHLWFESLLLDARHAIRSFYKRPAFTAVAVSTIAIGIGASTAVFSMVDPLLFRRLPYPHDEQLVSVGFSGPVDNNEFNVVSTYLDWRRQQTAFQSLTSMRPSSPCDVIANGAPRRITCFPVEANFLHTLGIAPLVGRDFHAEEDRPRAPTVVLISYALWQRQFGGQPNVPGRTITLDEEPVRIIGVLPKSFEMPQLGEADILLPERLDESRPRSANSSSLLRTFARLRNGASIQQAAERMQPLFERSVHDRRPRGVAPFLPGRTRRPRYRAGL